MKIKMRNRKMDIAYRRRDYARLDYLMTNHIHRKYKGGR